MHSLGQKRHVLLTFLIVLLLLSLPQQKFSAAQQIERKLMTLGSVDENSLDSFLGYLTHSVESRNLRILILPITAASNPDHIPNIELKRISQQNESLKDSILQRCAQLAGSSLKCEVELAPVYLFDQLNQPELHTYFRPGLSAILIPEGTSSGLISLIQGTELEQWLDQAYRDGVIIAAGESGISLLTRNYVTDYQSGFGRSNALQFGALKLSSRSSSSINSGLDNLIIDSNFFSRGRFGRLLNAITVPEKPGIGLGVDESCGVQIINEQFVTASFGSSFAAILDGSTYHASESVEYVGRNNQLRIRNVLVHLLSPGMFSYDLNTRQHSLAVPPARLERNFDFLGMPVEAGELIISSSLYNDETGTRLLNEFVNLSGGVEAQITAVLLDKPGSTWIDTSTELLQSLLADRVKVMIIPSDSGQKLQIPSGTTGLILWGSDQSSLYPDQLEELKVLWTTGKPLLAVDAGGAVVGSYFTTSKGNPDVDPIIQISPPDPVQKDNLIIEPGLGLVNAMIQPNLLSGNRWRALIALAYHHPDQVAFGLNKNAAIVLDHSSPKVIGSEQVVSLDFRDATLSLVDGQFFGLANGLLDVFIPTDLLAPEPADMNHVPLQMNTPVVPVYSSTQTQTPNPIIMATRTISAELNPAPTDLEKEVTLTPTPTEQLLIIDPGYLHSMIFLGLFSVGVVMLGIWINIMRKKSR